MSMTICNLEGTFDKLNITDLILLVSSTDRPLLRCMHVFKIMQNVQEKFVSGILPLNTHSRSTGGKPKCSVPRVGLEPTTHRSGVEHAVCVCV